jgi:hypothetical protein
VYQRIERGVPIASSTHVRKESKSMIQAVCSGFFHIGFNGRCVNLNN